MNETTLILPEIFLALTLAGVLLSEIAYHGERYRMVSIIALTGLVASLVQILIVYQESPIRIFSESLAIDGISLFFKLFFVALAILAIVVSLFSNEISNNRRTEYYSFVVGSTLALSFLASASNLLLIFLTLLLVNIIGGFLAGYRKRSGESAEASIKYFVFSAVSGALFLYGAAILFEHTQTLNIYEMKNFLTEAPMSAETGLVVFALLFMSLCFFLGAFPMYFWMPDVLEGAPTPTSVFLSLGIPAAGIAVILRLFTVVFAKPVFGVGAWEVGTAFHWPDIVALTSGITMMLGALLALRQTGVKRMLAALVVSQSGFLLIGLLTMNQSGISALLYNLAVGLFSLIGLFCSFSFLFDQLRSDRLADFKGVLSKAVPECLCLFLFLACFIGFPPFPGFIGKFVLIGAALEEKWLVIAALAVISGVVGVCAFARLAYSLAGGFKVQSTDSIQFSMPRRVFLFSLFIPLILMSIFADTILIWGERSFRLIAG